MGLIPTATEKFSLLAIHSESLNSVAMSVLLGKKSDVVTHLMQWDKQAGKHHTAAATSTQTPAKGQAACLKWQRESDPDWDTGEDDSPDSEMGLSGEDDGNTDSGDSSPDVEKPRTVP